MNILHLSRTMGQGGAEKIVYELAAGCKKYGDRVCIASSGGIYEKMLKEQDILHFNIKDLECKDPRTILQTVFLLKKIIRSEKIQIIHSHHRMAALYGCIMKLFYPRIVLVYTAHNIFRNKRLLTKFSLSRSYIVAVGDSVKKNLEEYFRIPSNKIHIIYNGIYPEAIIEDHYNPLLKKLKEQGFRLVGTAGRLEPQKGMDTFVKIIGLLKRKMPEVKGIIIGDGSQREYLQQLIRQENLENEIFMLGYQQHIVTLLSQLDVVVMASRWEGFPLLPIETYSAKKTLVASDIEGIRDIVENGKRGILVSKDSPELFCQGIYSLFADKNLKEKMEQVGWEYYLNKFDYDKFLENYRKYYQKILFKEFK